MKYVGFSITKKDAPCPITDQLIAAGYMQKSGGYIKYARECGITNPTQYWHLIESWSKRSPEEAPFNKRIQCGELIFWMAEVSQAVGYEDLIKLKDEVVQKYLNCRKEGNKIIQKVCFDKIINLIDASASTE